MLTVRRTVGWFIGYWQRNGRRMIALFLLLVMLASASLPAASVYALSRSEATNPAAVDKLALANQQMKQAYPGAAKAILSDMPAAADAKGSAAQAGSLGVAPIAGEPLQSSVDPPKITPHELVSKRTAASSVSINKDGSLTARYFMTPKYFQKGGAWEAIDTALVEDKNAEDSGNVLGQAWGAVKSWFSEETTFKVRNNDWQARFAPSNAGVGLLRIKKDDQQIGFSPINANDVDPVITADASGRQTVRYHDLWPGVDVEYTVESAAVKENVIIKNKEAVNQVSFKVIGAALEKQQTKEKNDYYAIRGTLHDEFAIAPANLILNEFGPVTDETVFAQQYSDGVVTLSVDKDYLQNLPDSAFPAVIDPGVFKSSAGTRDGGTYKSFKSDGYICPDTVCNPYIGSLYDSGGTLRYWRGALFVPYDQFKNSGTVLTSATLHLKQRTNESFWTGDWGHNHTYQVGRATCLNSYNCMDTTWSQGSIGGEGDIDVTSLYQNRIANNDFGLWLMIMGQDSTTHSFKNLDPGTSTSSPNGTYVEFTYSGAPTAPSFTSPIGGQVYVDPQPSFRVTPKTNPNGSTPLKYEIRLSTGQGGAGGLVTSGLMQATQWTIPDGILQDGYTYYVQARSYDPITQTYSAWGGSVPFRIDMRVGQDKSQTYDNLGPVDVDLATGGLATSASSHASAALGGSLGVGLEYNSPLKSRNGLVGQYWNVTSGYSGGTPASAPLITRVDPNVDFSWYTGSPSDGTINTDWFFARWSGWFVAPTTGTYYFGGINDDNMSITVNNQALYASTYCWPGPCYGSTITLNAGQVVPIEVTFQEGTTNATAKLYIKGAVDEQILPQDWLQTGVRPLTARGLTGSYFARLDGTNTFSSGNPKIMERTDQLLSFDWGSGAPVPGGQTDFLARWTGYITVPVSGTYNFGSNADDGTKITIGPGNTVVYNDWSPGAGEGYGTGYSMVANTPVPITIEYFDSGNAANFQFKVQGAVPQQIVPADWLSPKAQVLPDGWNLGLDPDGDINYDHLKINQTSVVLTDSTGSTHEYSWTGTGYKPPLNEDGQLVRNADGTFTLQDVDGRSYAFAQDGTLTSLTSPVDDRNPAALQYEYQSLNGGPSHIYRIKDGADSSRMATVYYSGESECGSAPSGFDANAPAGMVCALKTNDGRATYFYYAQGQLARIAKPGNELTDYQYGAVTNPSGAIIGYQMVAIRDVAANDAVAAGVRANDDNVKTQITYDILGRVTGVTQPAPTTGASRVQHTIEYFPGIKSYEDQNGNLVPGYYGMTKQHIGGAAEPNGFTRRVKYDNLFRTIEDTDAINLSDQIEWDPAKDLVLSTTDSTGLKATTIYDDADRPTDQYGPAPAAWFGTDRQPLSTYANQVPHNKSGYDETVNGAAVAWYDYSRPSSNVAGVLFGAPKLHTTGLDPSNPAVMSFNWAGNPPITAGSGMQGVGFSATGKLDLPNGTYSINADTSDGIRVWVDDELVLDSWLNTGYRSITGGSFTVANDAIKRLRVDSYRRTGSVGAFNVQLKQTGGFNWTTNWAGYLKPGYNLATSSTAYDSTIGNTQTTTNYGSNPELGLVQSATVDPAGLNLTASQAYEQQGAAGSLLRQTGKTLPGGGTTSYSYYTGSETRDNPCTPATEAYKQAGFLKLKTEADPDGAGSQTSRVSEFVYDDAGRTVASRYNTDSWTCATYDTRGRITQTAIPAFNGAAAQTLNHDYDFGGDPLTSAHWDDEGWIVIWTDLLGRTTRYGDVHDQDTFYTYDNLGRLTEKDGPLGAEEFTYDSYHRLLQQKLDGTVLAAPHYDSYSRVDYVEYPSAGQQKLTIARDSLGRLSGDSYTLGNGSAGPSDSVTRSQSGRIVSGTELGQSKSYTYDLAGRLTAATIGSNTYSYSFGTPTGCSGTYNANSGKNSNRTSQTINGVTTSFCYDYADRLISSSNALYGTPVYDAHGNITQIGTGAVVTQLGYDSSDRNSSITEGSKSTAYERDVTGRIVSRTVTQPAAPALPSPWLTTSIGAPAQTGSSSYDSGTFTVSGNGYDIWGSDDDPQLTSQALKGDGTIIARISSITNTGYYAKAGIMFKDSLSAGSNYAAVMVYPNGNTRFQYNYATSVAGPTLTLPNAWLKLTRTGSTITAYSSADGTGWTQIGSASITLRNTTQAGLFATSYNTASSNATTFDNVSITKTTTLPTGWTNGDVGNPATVGSASYSSGVYTLSGAGTDVWDTDDQFHYAYETLSGNGEIVARVTSQTNTNEWAKAGIVVKASPSAGSAYASIHITPSHNIRMEHSFNTSIDGGSYTLPNTWLKLTRSGNTITTYKSTNGTSWTQVGTATISLPTSVTLGLYVSSVNPTTSSTATFDNVTLTPTSTSSTTYNYSYTSGADTPDLLLDGSNTILERYISLPGGVLLTIRSNGKTYSLPNSSGHVMATTDAAGALTGTFTYDPFGNAANTAAPSTPENTAVGSTFGWAGTYQKINETAFSLTPIQMGARVYLPQIGRFASVDLVEGGTANNYAYVGDPVNGSDYSGLLAVVSSSSNIILVVTYNYGMQSGWGGNSLQSRVVVKRVQGPGSMRSNTGRTSSPVQTPKAALNRIGGGVAKGVAKVGGGVASGVAWFGTGLKNGARKLGSNLIFKGAVIGCAGGALGDGILMAAASAGATGQVYVSAGAVMVGCVTGASIGVAKAIVPGSGTGADNIDMTVDVISLYIQYAP